MTPSHCQHLYLRQQSISYLYLIEIVFCTFWTGVFSLFIGSLPLFPYLLTALISILFNVEIGIGPFFLFPSYYGILSIILSGIMIFCIGLFRFSLINHSSKMDRQTFSIDRFEQEVFFGPSISKSIFDLADTIDTVSMSFASFYANEMVIFLL